jgi:hypothetical protein
MDHRQRIPEKTRGLRNLLLKEGANDEIDGKIRNAKVYRRIEEERTLWDTIEKRRTRWIGYILRHIASVKDIIKEKIEGKVLRKGQWTNKE